MKLKDSLNKRLNTRLASLVMLSVLSVPWVASAAGNSVVANNMLPGNGQQGNVIAGKIEGGFNGSWTQGNQMNLHQTTQNAIVTWDSFSIGANASVTIRGDHNNFNMLNYVTGSESSQIYGKLNSYVGDKQGGNIYLVNPNGVQIGNSAEINVGSLHIANKKIDNFDGWTENTDIANELKKNKAMTNAELMSLGYINANKLVFEGERVVIDMDRLSGLDTTKTDALTIVSQPYDGNSVGDNRKYDIVLGSSTPKNAQEWGKYMVFADVSDNGTGEMDTTTSTRWHGTTNVGNPDAPGQTITEFFTYRWIKDGKELEKIGQTEGWGMGDHYALRYSIDLTGSDQTPIGTTKENAFKGKFDGLDNSIFGLSINNSDNKKGDATGLFGFTDGAIMGNVTLIAGNDGISVQGGDTDTGAFIGHAVNTIVKGVNSTLKVSGKNNVGGIIGYAKDDTALTYSFADAKGSVQPDSRSSELSNLTNTGNVSGVTNVGGLVGYMDGGKLSNDEEDRAQYKGSYNLGKITGIDKDLNYSSNIGGLIGKAENAIVGGTKNTLINYNTVEGGYNVGGIVGSVINTTVANASNEGVVKANGFTVDSYIYHTDYTGNGWQNNDAALTGTHKAEVRAANVGGIVGSSSAGSELKDVTNKADVSSALVKKDTDSNDKPSGFDHYAAGNVGGIVGRAEDSNITNANNVESNIRGAMNVGGIAGVNEGEISADNQLNLVNSGKIHGWENVGGIAGKNSGSIANVNSNINLYVINKATREALKGNAEIAANAQFFGGVTGENVGIITNATNRARVDAAQASYVGGIVGRNTSENGKVGQLLGMGNSNKGFVIGNNYVGGVIGKNEVAITGTDEQSVGIVNSGTVIALAGGAGGIIGENSANITYVIMTNEGEVHGNASADGSREENGTGGIIGVNALGATITKSSLMNRVNGNVSGVANVGGIIGINHGVITGGRDDNNNYYKYQIYNNGTIQAGSYDEENGTITATAVLEENIGGLLGNNIGTLTAGYNTGVVKAGQSSNVGGIAGTNSGTLDQVFNSVVTVTKTETGATDAEGRKLYNYTYTDDGAISGASNVGGIVGSNTAGGQLSNAYSTTAVEGNSNVANIVGSNAGQVSNIYGYKANGNTNVTNVNGGTVSNSYIIKADGTLAENANDAKKLDSYAFDDTTWKLYDKRTNPLLKVFLTKVTVADDLPKGWVYDATNHLDIHGWIENGKLTTVDPKNDAFAAYNNNNSLLQGEELKNAGDYSSWLWSGQIASGGEVGPNNLGYDFTVGDITVTKKVLNVTGNTVNRTYGSLLKKDDHGLSIDYELSINGFGGFNDAMKAELNGKVTITDSQHTIQNSQDKGIITVDSEKRTNNNGSYSWYAGVKLDDSLTDNYEFKNDGVSSATTTVQGVSNVLARKVYLNNINASTTYGSKEGLKADGNVSLKENSIVYGDQVSLKDGASVSYKADGEYADNKGGRGTADAGTYADSLKIDNAKLTGDANKLGNYELVNNATGSITVDPETMHVKLNGVERTYGNTALINGTAYGVNSLLGNVNGDNYGAGHVNIGTVTGDGALTGKSTGKVTNDAGDTYKWNANVVAANDKLKQNYKLVVDDGASVVKQATLQVSLNDVVRTYGNTAITSGGYSASNITGLVNGDSYNAGDVKVTVTGDGAIAGVSGNRVTNDVDNNYTWSGTLTTDNTRLDKNYKLELKGNGVSKVGKATLTFVVDDKIITQNVPAEYTGTANGLTNGDTLAGIGVGGYELDSSVNPLIVGVYEDKIGVLINGSLHMTGSDSLLKNYRVEVNPGTLTVLISSDPTNAYWFGTAPWDKERNLRERKAEFHYVAGGMSL